MPPHWKIYLSVANAGDAAAKAKSLGGNVLMEPFDVFDAGRIAAIQDPSGGVFCAWETKTHPGFGLVDEPGAFCWGELNTNDTGKALTFYRQMFNWGIRGKEDGSSEYTEFTADGQSIGGMMAIKKEWGEVPPHWLAYYQVSDCDGMAAKAKDLGATLMVPGTDIPGTGRFAIIRDPQGAVFAIIELRLG